MDKRKQVIDSLFIGLALFATYFGAGNLIFPPILGLQSGNNFVLGIIGLVMSGIFIPVAAMVVIGIHGSANKITEHISKNCYNLCIMAVMFIVLFVGNPRTAATAIEMGVQGIFPSAPYAPFVIIYFILVFFIAKDKGKVLDKVGKYITPVLFIILLILIIMGIVHPIGAPVSTELKNPLTHSLLQGYQTGDVLVSFLMASVFLANIQSKGYIGKDKKKVITMASIVAFIGLFIVYGGLFYMGACGSGIFPQDIGRAELLVAINKMVGGQVAMNALGIAVILACFTTAVGQATAGADFFVTLSKGKFNYKITMACLCILSALMALIGVDRIVMFANPIYSAVYPVLIVIILLGVFSKIIPNDGAYKGAIILTLIYSVCEALNTALHIDIIEVFVNTMPFASNGFGWVVPCIVGFIFGLVIYPIMETQKLINKKEC